MNLQSFLLGAWIPCVVLANVFLLIRRGILIRYDPNLPYFALWLGDARRIYDLAKKRRNTSFIVMSWFLNIGIALSVVLAVVGLAMTALLSGG